MVGGQVPPRPSQGSRMGCGETTLALGTQRRTRGAARSRRRSVSIVKCLRPTITVDPSPPVPPDLYGGIERVADFLVRGLVERGHEVTLYAHPDSNTAGSLVPYGAPPHTGRWLRFQELCQLG